MTRTMSSTTSMTSRPLSRRTLLRGAGGVAVALPWLEAMTGKAQAQSAPRRFVTMFSGAGTHPPKWFPTGGETDFQLSPFLAPLAPVRQDIVIFKGIHLLSAGPSQPGDGHGRGMYNLFTATPGTSQGVGGGISVDQQIAKSTPQARFRSLEFGVQVRYNGDATYERLSFLGANQALPPEDNPVVAFKRIFGDFTADPAALDRLLLERRSILDVAKEDLVQLSRRLGGEDKKRVDAHLASVRGIETRLTSASGQGGACGKPAAPTLVDYRNPANFAIVGKIQMDLLAAALACDLVRVASLMWSQGRSKAVHTHLGISDEHHELSHDKMTEAASAAKIAKINIFYVTQFAYLIQALKGYREGGGSVLDNTAVLWGNELGEGRSHSHTNIPFVLAGRAGGRIKTGRFLTYPGLGHGDLMVSMLNVFGVPQTTFGNPAFCKGPLPGL